MPLTTGEMERVLRVLDTYAPRVSLSAQIPLSEYRLRHAEVWRRLREKNIDLGFFFWYREMPGDGLYLTGYNPTIERASGVIAPGKPPLILAGPESGLLAEEVGLDLETSFVREFSIPDEYYEGIEYASLREVVGKYAGKIKTIGLMTSRDILPEQLVSSLANDVINGVELVDATDILKDMRYEKSENELACMHQADVIASAAVRAMLSIVRPELRECEVAAVADFVIKSLGADGYGVETQVTSGPRCKTVIGPASNKVILDGENVLLACSPSFRGYKGVARRNVIMGKRTALQKEFFDVMNEAYRRAEVELEKVVQNDLPTNRIDLAAREYFASREVGGRNMKPYHLYSTGHGTGLTECLEQMVIHPLVESHYGENVGIMLDLGVFGYPNDEICGACVEGAYFKRGRELLHLTDLPVDVQHLLGLGLE